VHPKARIIAEGGPIIIGEGNLIEERCEIINRYVLPEYSVEFLSCVCTLHILYFQFFQFFIYCKLL